MSPEQIKSTKDVTLQSDIYSLGVVLWQMATGRKPYDLKSISTFELQTKIVTEKLPVISSIFNEIIEIATDKDLKNRFNNCKEFSNKFSNVQNKNFEKTLIYEDNNSVKTSVETNVDKTVVESDQNSNTIPKPQINISVTPPKPTGSSPVIYLITGIVLVIVLGVIFTNRTYNSHSPELPMDTTIVEEPVSEDSTAAVAPEEVAAEGENFTGESDYYDAAENNTTIVSTIVSFYNNSPYTVKLACAFYDRGGWETIGWYEIFPYATEDVNLPETIDKNSFYWHVEDEHGETWSEEDGYFCVSHSDKFHFYVCDFILSWRVRTY
jgi:serine/threonine protein kinase